jgi:hypothetical protein
MAERGRHILIIHPVPSVVMEAAAAAIEIENRQKDGGNIQAQVVLSR